MEAVIAAERMCCVCRTAGGGIQIHHIDEDPENNDPSNLAVLCPRHHSEAHMRGGFGRQLDARHVTHHRDTWNAIVRHRRQLDSSARAEAADDSDPDEEPLLAFLREILTIDFSWEGPFWGEFGEFSALDDEAYFQQPGRESLKTKPRLFHTYWGLAGSSFLMPDLFREQAVSATQRLTDRFGDGRWIETFIPDYHASPIEGVRAVKSVRHTAKAASILLLTHGNDELTAEILWNLVDAAGDFMNADGGCREELFEQPSSIYASAYMLQLLAPLVEAGTPAFLPDAQRWTGAATEIVEALHGYMAASWSENRWAWDSTPWEVNAPYIIVDAGPLLRPRLREEVRVELTNELTSTGRLKDPDIGASFGAPEPLRALRVAYALRCVGEAADNRRASGLGAWLLKQDWAEVRLRPCDVTFLAQVTDRGG